MAVIIHRYRIAYFPIHKCASTSIKKALYLLETEKPFARLDFDVSIHQIYRFVSERETERWRDFFPYYLTFAIVRDPIKRAISAYAHRVIVLKCLEEKATKQRLKRLGLSLTPTIDEFFLNLSGYSKASAEVRRHVRPQMTYIGSIFNNISHIVPIERTAEAAALLSGASGKQVTFKVPKNASPKIELHNLSRDSINLLKTFYTDDYRMLADFYSAPD